MAAWGWHSAEYDHALGGRTDSPRAPVACACADRFVHLNLVGFRKITKKFDKVLRERASVWLSSRLAQEAFCQVRLEPLLVGLGEVQSLLRSSDLSGASHSKPTAKTEFRRDVTKFWIHAVGRPAACMCAHACVCRRMCVWHAVAPTRVHTLAASHLARASERAPAAGA